MLKDVECKAFISVTKSHVTAVKIAGATLSNYAFLYVSLTLFVEAGVVSIVVGVLYTLQDIRVF